MRHRQKILNHYPDDTDVRVLAVSFRCSPSEYAALAHDADACGKTLGAYVRDEVLARKVDPAGRPRTIRLQRQIVTVLNIMAARQQRLNLAVRASIRQGSPIAETTQAELSEVARSCRDALQELVTAMHDAPALALPLAPPTSTRVANADTPGGTSG